MTEITITLAVAGKFALNACDAMLSVYTPDLYPTLLRMTGVLTSSLAAEIGSIPASYVYLLVRILLFLVYLQI